MLGSLGCFPLLGVTNKAYLNTFVPKKNMPTKHVTLRVKGTLRGNESRTFSFPSEELFPRWGGFDIVDGLYSGVVICHGSLGP